MNRVYTSTDYLSKNLLIFIFSYSFVRYSELPILNKVSQSAIIIHEDASNRFEWIKHQMEELINSKTMPILLMLSDDINLEMASSTLNISINEKVYFYQVNSKTLVESYVINNVRVKQKLGEIHSGSFSWEKSIQPNFDKRRADFKGLVLRSIVEFSGFSMNADKSYVAEAPFFTNNKTYLVNGFTYGIFDEVLSILESTLNFTCLRFKNQVEAWGDVYPQGNGTYKGTK